MRLSLALACLACLASSSGGVAGAQNAPPRQASAARVDPCRGVACGGHGRCVSELEDAFCFCDEGYSADALQCVPSARATEGTANEEPAAIGLAIVQIASAEEGRDLAHVGLTRTGAPGPLARFVRPGGLWCSDFVSWVYRAAGLPFTGGYHGGWMLPNNEAIRGWFERRGRWVDRAGSASSSGIPFAGFTPRAGDYVRVSTPTWNHSVIVRYVEGSTLHAVEGNAGGHVHLTRYRRWRDDPRLQGFGVVAMARARMEAWRVSNTTSP